MLFPYQSLTWNSSSDLVYSFVGHTVPDFIEHFDHFIGRIIQLSRLLYTLTFGKKVP